MLSGIGYILYFLMMLPLALIFTPLGPVVFAAVALILIWRYCDWPTRRLYLLTGGILIGSCNAYFSWPPIYVQEPFSGRVVDAVDAKPIEGAVVVASWKMQGPFMYWLYALHGPPEMQVKVRETLTDREGRFSIPKVWWARPTWYSMRDMKDPELVVFKPGYKHLTDNNSPFRHSMGIKKLKVNDRLRFYDRDGATWELFRFEGSNEEWNKELEQVWLQATEVGSTLREDERKMPMLMKLFETEKARIGRPVT